MTKRPISEDFRMKRELLPDEVFALVSGSRSGPRDLVPKEIWNGIMHLPDHVALTTSNHHGSELGTLYSLWGDWLEAMGHEHDELFSGMLDAADCFQASTFDMLHGYYRSALSNLRVALELVAIGALGNLSPDDTDYFRWKSRKIGSLPFATAIKKLRGVTRSYVPTPVFAPKGIAAALYEELCAYTHSRPDASDGEMWSSNGPIYVTSAVNLAYKWQMTTYATCYLLSRIGRPSLTLPKTSQSLFTTPGILWRDDIATSFNALRAKM
jgi:hypothetical protein